MSKKIFFSLILFFLFLSHKAQEPNNINKDFPIFPVCKLIPKNLQQKCFNESIEEHISKFFIYPKTANDLGLQSIVNVFFDINVNGSVSNIKAKSSLVGVKFENKEALLIANQLFEEAALSIFNKLPKMTPGKINDSVSSISFKVPVTYRLAEKSDLQNQVFPINSVEWAPLYPGCEEMDSDGSKTCFKEKVQNHINKYLRYPKKANKTEKDVVVFIEILIENDGVIYDLTSLGPNLFRQEAERVIKKLPYFEPALNNDIPVAVSYTIPILFNSKINK